jgi:2,4-dienoyl-CoA reductase-like NADH-dependent reductase (Old Yellow Enzyme family)
MTKTVLHNPITLPCGFEIKNRLIKSAMSESLADKNNLPARKMNKLYQCFGQGGLGLLISGNVMVDPESLGEPANMVLAEGQELEPYRLLASVAQENGTPMWLQLNHPGRQAPRFNAKPPVAPSAITVNVPGMFVQPKEMTELDIQRIIMQFGTSAGLAQKAGFSGVQIHGGHGYLISQFLSPATNRRLDKWGGSLENRVRFLVEVYRAIRQSVGNKFPVGLKLNATDFQKGGFEEDESIEVIRVMEKEGVDLLEVTGGTYEKSLAGRDQSSHGQKLESTKMREAYFLDFARKARESTTMPLAACGGFRSKDVMIEAIESGALDVIGLGRPITVDPLFADKILTGQVNSSSIDTIQLGIEALDKTSLIDIGWHEMQMRRIASGRQPKPNLNAWRALAEYSWFNTGSMIRRLSRFFAKS